MLTYFSLLFSLFFFISTSILVLFFSNLFFLFDFGLNVKHVTLVDFFNIQLDGISLMLIWLTSFVVFLCILYSINVSGFGLKKQLLLLLFLEIILTAAFVARSLFIFYVLFESVLIPMYILIGLGSRGRKFHANMLFFFFTFASSLFLLSGIFFIFFKTGTLSFEKFFDLSLSISDQKVVFWLFLFGFAAKIPLVPLHIWLPEAHVEAPTIGSVILAAILLKLGGYGLYRVILPLCQEVAFFEIGKIILPFILISIIFPAFAAIRQVDFKKIVAYSSVVHMGFALLGLFSLQDLGIQGFIFLMISHGLISGGMFFCVGMLYDRFHTRNLLYYGGLVQFMPIFSFFFFILIFSNMSLPGTCNFIGEFFVLIALFNPFGFMFLLFIFFGLFLTVLFCLILLYKIIFYQISGFLCFNLVDITLFEFLILIFLGFYIIFFGILPNFLLQFFIF